MPRGGDLRQYRPARDLGTEGDATRTFYDLCRDTGLSREQSRQYAALAARKHARDHGQTDDTTEPTVRLSGATGEPPPPREEPVCRSAFKTPYFGPYAGQLCRVAEDGTLTPVQPKAQPSSP